MAKSKLEKLIEVLESARVLLIGLIVGTEAGQYAQSDVDEFNALVSKAEEVAADESLEPSQYDEALTSLNAGMKVLQSKVVKPPVEDKKASEAKSGLKRVSLKGTVSQRKGSHTIHFKQTIVTFQDGEAELPEKLAADLIKAGYAE